jgi:hypothetical protein
MARANTTTMMSAKFIWPNPSVDGLKALVHGSVKSFLPDLRIYAKNTIEASWQSETTYESTEQWLSDIGTDFDRVWASLSDDSLGRQITFDWEPPVGALRITAQGPATDSVEPQFKALFEAFTVGLGLVSDDRYRGERLFAPSTTDGAWLAPTIAMAQAITGASARFKGSWHESDIVIRETKIESDWLARIPKARRWRGEWSGRGHQLEVEFQDNWGEVTIRIASWDGTLVVSSLEQLTSIAGLEPRVRDAQKQGDFRKYFLAREATPDWYSRALTALQAYSGGGSSFWGRVVRGGKSRSRRGYGNFPQWRAALDQGMAAGDIELSYFSYQRSERSITFELDHVRDALSIDIQSVGGKDVEQMHSTLSADLDLALAPEDAYRYRQWGRTYEIKWADSAAFANRLESGFNGLFRGRRVALKTATLHAGGDEEQVKTYSDIKSLSCDLKTMKELSEIHVVAEGPRGEFMGIHVEKNLSRMRLLALVEFDRFQVFASELKDGLQRMKLREAYDGDADSAATQEKKSGWILPVVALAASLATGLLGSEAFKAIREASELNFDVPVAKDGVALVESPNVSVSWTYKEPHLFGHPTIDENHEAFVDVTRQADAKLLVKHQRFFGSLQLSNLSYGTYIVRVTSDQTYKTLAITVLPKPGLAAPSKSSKSLSEAGEKKK